MKLLRIDKNTKNIIDEYIIAEDENIVFFDNQICLMSNEEYRKFLNRQIEDFEIQEAPFGLSINEILKIEE